MDPETRTSYWDEVSIKVKKFLKDLENESVSTVKPRPIDCCNPPVPPKSKQPSGLKLKSG